MDIFFLKSEIWLSRLQNLKEKNNPNWNMDHLDKVLIKLKNNKTMDPNGMVNEIFKAGCIGSDLKKALLLLLNGSKANQLIPIFMTLSNITSIYKNKGSKLDLNNDRGIFILTVIKRSWIILSTWTNMRVYIVICQTRILGEDGKGM